MTDFHEYIDAENTFAKEADLVFGQPLQIAIEVWNFIHMGMVRGVDRQAPLVLAHYTQVANSLFGAISAMTRHHSAQFYQCTRYAKEHIAICFFMLRKLPEANHIFLKHRADYASKCKTQGYELMKKDYPKHHQAMVNADDLSNEYGSHATFMTTVPNTDLRELGHGGLETNLFDDLPTHLCQTRLLVLTDMMLMFCDVVLHQQFDPGTLPIKPEAKDGYKILMQDYARVKEAHRRVALQHRSKIQSAKGSERNDPCWCDSGKKRKKCHG